MYYGKFRTTRGAGNTQTQLSPFFSAPDTLQAHSAIPIHIYVSSTMRMTYLILLSVQLIQHQQPAR